MKIATILIVGSLIMFPVIGLAQTSTTQSSTSAAVVNPNTTYYCGDGKCDKIMGETTANCEKDCPQETTTLRWGNCGDKICQPDETKSSCSVDCGYPWVCGDGICGGTETDWNCPQDCPKSAETSLYCGDKICQSDESQRSCPIDCGYSLICGDGICSGTDTSDNCPKDCPRPATSIGATTNTETTNGGGSGCTLTGTPVCGNDGKTYNNRCIAEKLYNVSVKYDGECNKPTTIYAEPVPPLTTKPVSALYRCGDKICYSAESLETCPEDCGPENGVAISPYAKCGMVTAKVCNECGLGVYKNVFVKCSDGSEITLGSASSCKPVDLWNQYAKEACTNHCSSGGWGGWSELVSPPIVCAEGGSDGRNITTPLPPTTVKPVEIPKTTPVCYISGDLMQQYNKLILELQKSGNDKARADAITQQIIALKQQITAQQKECVNTSPQMIPSPTPAPISIPTPTIFPRPSPMGSPIEIKNIPVDVSINHCNEIAQWETKIAYYKKISSLSNDELKKSGFSREEIEKITQELSSGIEKVRGKCDGKENTPVMPRITTMTGSVSIEEKVRPVVAESGQEISTYYKARIEKAVSVKGEEKQIQELKTLRNEIDGLISNLIKSRKELEVSELNNLVKEVKVSRGEIKADDVSVKTTEKKMLVSIGDRPVSIEPTVNQVLIRDKGLEINTNEVTIEENVLSIGGVEVKMSASEVTEKLGLAPKAVELKEENMKAVYDMKINERRKLFGFIPFDRQRTITADAENGNILSENLPWYNFMTTK